MTRLGAGVVAVLLVALGGGSAASATDAVKRNWREEKCFRYARDWNEALRRYGRDGLSDGFLDGGAAFVRSHCVAAGAVCPATAKDRTLVDVLAIRVVNEGMSTTFLPFGCPDRNEAP